jgi:phosphoglycolate phosphatase
MPLIVFDLDGTLIDSRRDLTDSTNEMLESYGDRPLPVDQVAAFVGEGAKRLVERALEAAGRDVPIAKALQRFRASYDRRLLVHTRPYDGIDAVVRAASAHARLAVLTNKPDQPTRRLLEAFDLAASFTWVIGGDTAFPRKPDPAALRYLMSEARTTPAETLFVGDSMIDIETAKRADVRICVARYGFGHLREDMTFSGDELVALSPADVGAAIDRFLGSQI